MHPLLVLIPLPLLAEQPDAHWAFDGPTLAERLAEGYGRVALDAGEAVGASSWNTRSGFGEVLANGTDDPYLEVAGGAALDPGSGDFSISVWSYRSTDDGSAAGIVDALDNVGIGFQFFYQASGALRLRLDDDLGNTVNADTAGRRVGRRARPFADRVRPVGVPGRCAVAPYDGGGAKNSSGRPSGSRNDRPDP